MPNTRYYYNNLLVTSFNNEGKIEWNNLIPKEQYADENDNYLSFITFNTGGQIHFLYNLIDKRKFVFTDYSITASGMGNRNPTFRKLNDEYEFMPQFGKQIGARQILLPCTFRNRVICFAKIDY